jgi:hypothetical protein
VAHSRYAAPVTTRGVLRAAALAVVLASAWVVARPAPTLGQEGLPIVSHAHYEVLPDERRIHVTVDAVATSTTPSTVTEIVSYVGTNIPLLPGAAGVAAFGPRGEPLVTRVVAADEDHTLVEVNFDQDVRYGQSYSFRLEFDLPDPGGDPIRPVRIGPTLVAFPVWAFGTPETPGSSVSVAIPATYRVDVLAGELTRAAGADGGTLLSSGTLGDPIDFFAYVSADRIGALVDTRLALRLDGREITGTVQAWPEDAAWGAMVTSVVERGLPALRTAIGLPFPDDSFRVVETAVSRLGGYAGTYRSANSVINVAAEADAFVVLHELSHAWFNAQLLSDRWINEAFASYYAEHVLDELGETGLKPDVSDFLKDAAAIPLNQWGDPGHQDPVVEEYAYAATLEVGRLIGAAAGDAVLREVWKAIDGDLAAYQRVHASEPERLSASAPGWQLLLDHLAARGVDAEGIWRDWVTTPEQTALLDERTEARAELEATLVAAGDWELPRGIRDLMSTWRFEEALDEMEVARSLLQKREELAAAAARVGVEPTGRLRAAFEGDEGLERALVIAGEELSALRDLEAASQEAERRRSWLEAIGLLGETPSAALAEARTEFRDGDPAAARELAREASASWQQAAARGQDRATLAGAAGAALLGLTLATASGLRAARLGSRGKSGPSVDRPEIAPDGDRQEGDDQHHAHRDDGHGERSPDADTSAEEDGTDRKQEAAREGP